MTTRTTRQLDAIIRDKMPGYHVVENSASTRRAGSDAPRAGSRRRRRVDASTPSIADLREKFLGSRDAGRPDSLGDTEDDEADIVEIAPDEPSDRRRRNKTVVVGADGRILGAQG